MSGDTANTAIWTGADVYIAPAGTAGPTDVTTPWPAGWNAAGLLDGDEGFTLGRDEESGEFYAWGGILFAKTKSKHKRTIKFVAVEDNDVVFQLVNPGSDRTLAAGVTTSTVKVPLSNDFAIGFETRYGTKIQRRIVDRATVEEIDEIKESETDPTVFGITTVIYPAADGTLYTEIKADTATP
jgi:hypothetical protein